MSILHNDRTFEARNITAASCKRIDRDRTAACRQYPEKNRRVPVVVNGGSRLITLTEETWPIIFPLLIAVALVLLSHARMWRIYCWLGARRVKKK